MSPSINEIALEITPQQRFDVIDIKEIIRQQFGNFLDQYNKSYYCSFHTTAGFFEQSLCSRLEHSKDHLTPYIRAFQNIFPSDANYSHDQIQLRTELSEDEFDSFLNAQVGILDDLPAQVLHIARRQHPNQFTPFCLLLHAL